VTVSEILIDNLTDWASTLNTP